MIEFKMLEGSMPRAVEASTDDQEAELAAMTEAFEESGWSNSTTAENLVACAEPNSEGRYVFVIPGDEAGEIADVFDGIGIDLWSFLASANQATLGEALKHQE